jgi:hypothetical protein
MECMPENNKDFTSDSLTPHQLSKINTISSYLTAVSAAIVFHPIDRALFLSVANKRQFFIKANFVKPFHGIFQTVMYKQFTGSIYFLVQGELQQRLYPFLHSSGLNDTTTQLLIGSIAGAIDGVVKNTPTAIRANTWQYGGSFILSTGRMWKNGGVRPFVNGAPVSILRDTLFGATYEVTRKNLHALMNNQKNDVAYLGVANFLSTTIAAGTATIASAPINYARTMQYKTQPGLKPPTVIESIRSLSY